MSEAQLSKDIQVQALRDYRCKLMRNNSGSFVDRTGRHIRFGLGNLSKVLWNKWKTSDLIGYTVVTVTPDMVGKSIAVFTAVEVKQPNAKKDDRYKAQELFIKQVKSEGGIASICDSLDSLKKMFKSFFTQG